MAAAAGAPLVVSVEAPDPKVARAIEGAVISATQWKDEFTSFMM